MLGVYQEEGKGVRRFSEPFFALPSGVYVKHGSDWPLGSAQSLLICLTKERYVYKCAFMSLLMGPSMHKKGILLELEVELKLPPFCSPFFLPLWYPFPWLLTC